MSQRIILLTGGNGGLGRAMARAFLNESPANFVWLGVRTHRGEADRLVGEFPDRARCLELEVTRADAWQAAVTRILSEHPRLDVLVNNAGRHQDSLLATMPPDAWRSVMDANLDSVFHGCQAVLPAMIAQKHGRIVNVSSLSALLAPPGQTNYAAAKAGVVALTQSLAKEVARIGITVNAICPGYIDSGAFDELPAEERKAITVRIPMRRFGRPEEIAAAVKFLAGAEAGYITGATLKIDGGIF
jgi:3-oxoacyl-[acyl-carrier protein] reductase